MSNTSDERVGRIVRILLADQGLKQRDLGRELNMDSGQVSRAMRGQRKWTLSDLEHMSTFFRVGVATFFEDADSIVRSRCFSSSIDQLELFANNQLVAA